MKYLLLFLIVLIFNCCKVAQELDLQRISYNGQILNINGYYYSTESDGQLFFLYNDGTFLDFSIRILEIENMNLFERKDSSILFYSNKGNYKNTQYGWGLWTAEGGHLIIEKWLTGSGGPYPVGRFIGDIINDTTIDIAFTYQLPPKGDEEKKRFLYRKFNPKPDSTNSFIK